MKRHLKTTLQHKKDRNFTFVADFIVFKEMLQLIIRAA